MLSQLSYSPRMAQFNVLPRTYFSVAQTPTESEGFEPPRELPLYPLSRRTHSAGLCQLSQAEIEGFEPSEELTSLTRFPGVPVQPLRHISFMPSAQPVGVSCRRSRHLTSPIAPAPSNHTDSTPGTDAWLLLALHTGYVDNEAYGGREIRTPEGFHPAGFQDQCIQPLCHPSKR
jgi:hypothetical protein